MHIPSKKNAYRRDFDETQYMSLLIKDDELLERFWNLEKSQK